MAKSEEVILTNEDRLDEIVYRIGNKGPEHSEILAKAVAKYGKAVNYDINQIANLLFGAFINTVCFQDEAAQVKRLKGSRQHLTELLFTSRIWVESGGQGSLNMITAHQYAKDVETVIEVWDKNHLTALESEARFD
jgi:hypothetical protein